MDQLIYNVDVSSQLEREVVLGEELSCTTQPRSKGNQSLSRDFSSIGIARIKLTLI